MGIFGSTPLPDDEPPVDTSPGNFSRSFGRGLRAAGGQLQSVAGGIGEAVGAQDFARDRYADAQATQAAIEADAASDPNYVGSFRDVRGVRDAYNYATGLIGGSIPQTGATILGSVAGGLMGGPGGAILGGTLASAPFHTGDVIQRQQNDPVSLRSTSAQDRLLQAGVSGAGSAVTEAAIPGMLVGRVIGPATRRSVGQVVRGIPGTAAAEGATEAAGEAVKQTGLMASSPQPYDTEALLEAGVGGAVAGGALAGVGAGGEIARNVVATPGNVLAGAKDAIVTGYGAARDYAQEALGAAGKAGSEALQKARDGELFDPVIDKLGSAYDASKAAASDFVNKVAEQADVADLSKLAGITDPERIKAMMPTLDAERVQRVTEWGQELLSKAKLTDEQKAGLAQAMTNLGDRANQAYVANLKRGADAASRVGAAADRLVDKYKPQAEKALGKFKEDTKAAFGKAADAAAQAGGKAGEKAGEMAEDFAQGATALMNEYGPKLGDQADAFTRKARALYRLSRQKGAGALEHFSEGLGKLYSEHIAGEGKKSEDYSGAREAILDEVEPLLQQMHPGILGSRMDREKLADGLLHAIDAFRDGGAKAVSMDTAFALVDTFGDRAVETLERVSKVLGTADEKQVANLYEALMEFSRQEKDARDVLGTMQQTLIPELQGKVTTSQLREELEGLMTYARSRAQAGLVRGEPLRAKKGEKPSAPAPMPTARQQYTDDRVRLMMEARYGKEGTTRILNAVEKATRAPNNVLDKEHTTTVEDEDEDGNVVEREMDARDHAISSKGGDEPFVIGKFVRDAKGQLKLLEDELKPGSSARRESGQEFAADPLSPAKTIYYGPTKGGLALQPDLDPGGDKGQAIQALERAKRENPDMSVSFLTARELGMDHPAVREHLRRMELDLAKAGKTAEEAKRLAQRAIDQYGMVVAEGSRDIPGRIDKSNFDSIRVAEDDEKAKTSHLKNPGVMRVNGHALDAPKLTRLMRTQHEHDYVDSDDKGYVHRTARMFMIGLAALQDFGSRKPLEFQIGVKKNAEGKNEPVYGPEPPDDLVIDIRGKTKLTYGQIKGLSFTPFQGDNFVESRLKKLRKEVAALNEQIKKAPPGEKGPLREQKRALVEEATDLIDAEIAKDPREDMGNEAEPEGTADSDPFGQVHQALGGRGKATVRQFKAGNPWSVRVYGEDPEGVLRVDEAGNSLDPRRLNKDWDRLDKGQVQRLRELVTRLGEESKSTSGKAIAARAVEVLNNVRVMNKRAHIQLADLIDTKDIAPSQVATTINALHAKYKDQFPSKLPEVGQGVRGPKTKPIDLDEDLSLADKDFATGKFPELKTKGAGNRYLLRAYKRWGELHQKDKLALDDKGPPLTEEEFAAYTNMAREFDHRVLNADLSSFYADGVTTDAAVRKFLNNAAPEVAESTRPKGSKSSLQGIGSGPAPGSSPGLIKLYLTRVLGPRVITDLNARINHAGDWRLDPQTGVDIIRVSAHALNPLSVAYHEALHGLFNRLKTQNPEIRRVLEQAAKSAPIMSQLKKHLANEPAALAQLSDPEEAAAYMYQFWAQGLLTLGNQTQSLFNRISKWIRTALGIWTNDERAAAILEYFHAGEFQKNQANPSAVAKALVEAGRNQTLDKVRSWTRPIENVVETLMAAGGERLRDTGIPALRELANLMKVTGRDSDTDDTGFIPAARSERARRMNLLAVKLRGYTQAELDEALEAMQSGTRAASPKAQAVQDKITGTGGLLPTMLEYMRKAGVDVKKIHASPDYFPRKYDAPYIARHKAEFVKLLESHGRTSSEAERIAMRLMNDDGADFTIETDRPGMQNLKVRTLADIPDQALAKFMRKDLFEILDSYVTQATRRAEWSRRFGDEGHGLVRLLATAKKQGATDDQLDVARKYIRAVDGTLGDTLNPTARHIMGNVVIYQNLRLLPLAVFSSVVDPLGIIVRGGEVKDAFAAWKRAARSMVETFRGENRDAQVQLAELVGTVDAGILSALYTQGMAGDTARKLNDLFFKYNFMEGVNRSMRVAATQAAIKFMEKHASGTASKHSERWMAELGFKPGEYKTNILDPKVVAAINLWVDGAVLRPDAADKPIWMSDPVWMLVSHLKQFAHSFQETILKRVLHEARHNNYAPASVLTSYVPVMIASDLLKDILSEGGDVPEWKKNWGAMDYLGHGIERAGLMGAKQFALDGPGMMMGPTAQQVMEWSRALDGEGDIGRAAARSLPAATLWN